MTPGQAGDSLCIIGPGRMGLSLGSLLHEAGVPLRFVGRHPDPPDHPLFRGSPAPVRYTRSLAPSPDITGVLIAVPDREVGAVAQRLAEGGDLWPIPVLHLSGALELDVLAPLSRVGASVGSLHPLAAVPDPERGAERLRGAPFGIEGEGAALRLAERVVRTAGGRSLRIPPGGKPLYHAAAVLASNHLVALLAVAERLMARAGIPPEQARPVLADLARGAAENVAERGPVQALTGPFVRGDAETIRLHLGRLSAEERALYCLLGRDLLRLARQAGLGADLAERIGALLTENE